MKKITILTALLVVLSVGMAFGAVLSDDPGEFSVKGMMWFPGDGDFDLFDMGYGVSVSYREWFSFPFGVGVSAGLADWTVDGDSDAYKSPLFSDYDGSAVLIPIGASLYYCPVDWENWMVTINTGLQYVFINSDVTVKSSEDNKRHDVDIDGALIWNIGMDVEYLVGESWYVLGGLGYQMDVIDADTDGAGYPLRDTSLQGFYLQVGAKLLF